METTVGGRPGTAVDVVVAVVSFNSEDVLPGLVASLDAGLAGLTWHLVVADNDSRDDSVAVVRRLLPAATVVETGRNGGYAAGINRAVEAAPPHRAVLVLNPDVRLHPGCGQRLTAALAAPGTGVAVPRLLDAEGRLIYSQRREPSIARALGDAVLGATRAGRSVLLGEVVTDDRGYRADTVTDWAEGSTQLVSAACWERVGPWDESYFLYSEETDFDLRARDLGLRTRFVADAVATHLEGGSAGSAALWPLVVLNRVRLYHRRHGRAASVTFWAVTVLREASRAALGRDHNRAALKALVSPRRLREMPGPHSVAMG
jgi:N-acetylglucosaminyl-diphospho-decaprenol L-rhamnosyltransferase